MAGTNPTGIFIFGWFAGDGGGSNDTAIYLQGWFSGTGVAPLLVLNVADNADGTGATASIAGSVNGTTNTVYYAPYGSTAWVNGGNRSGDGTVSLSITSSGLYWAYVLNDNAGTELTSVPVQFSVTTGADVFGPEEALRQLLLWDRARSTRAAMRMHSATRQTMPRSTH